MKFTIMSRCTGTALLLCCLAGAAQAGETYYRWTEGNGTVVNSDRPPPPGIDYQVIGKTAGLTMPDDEPEQAAPSVSPPAPAQPAPQKTAQVQHQAVQKDPKACEDARQNLETLSTYARIRLADESGSIRYLNQEEKAAQRLQAEAAISQFCE